MKGLSQNFDNGFGFSRVGATHEIENDDVRGQHTLCEGFGFGDHFKLCDGVTGDRHG